MAADVFEQERPRLTAIAYGMLGSVMEAEDVVQDAFLRWAAADAERVRTPAAYLTTVTTRLAIDRLRSAQHNRESYVGPWLPEPLVTAPGDDPAETVAEAERLTMALLVTLERLNPVERAVFLLRELYDLDYVEIAPIVDRTPENCRQIARRARSRVTDPARTRPAADRELELVTSYAAAIAAEDVDHLASLLAEDVVLWSDGGGKARAARHPLSGREKVAKYLIGVTRRRPSDLDVQLAVVNGGLGWAAFDATTPQGVVTFDFADDVIVGIRIVLNPDKLAHLRPGGN